MQNDNNLNIELEYSLENWLLIQTIWVWRNYLKKFV